ncbi:hypothetical protein DOY81_001867 [Sarcophaga bullata]|nr:hypothetical protein DOY81_001867 [Sarcophaga bullata]
MLKSTHNEEKKGCVLESYKLSRNLNIRKQHRKGQHRKKRATTSVIKWIIKFHNESKTLKSTVTVPNFQHNACNSTNYYDFSTTVLKIPNFQHNASNSTNYYELSTTVLQIPNFQHNASNSTNSIHFTNCCCADDGLTTNKQNFQFHT